MNGSLPKVLVIIVTWNKRDYVLQLLASFNGLLYPRECLDVVVVDNASNDGTAEVVETSYPHVHLIRNPTNVGGTGGFNTGMSWAFQQPEDRYDYLWLLDNDVIVHSRALQELIAVMEKSARIGVVGSTMMQLDYPFRVNEMGCFFRRDRGDLILNRHFEEISALQAHEADDLAADENLKLSKLLLHCRKYMDVDYVAAASLLVRAELAREAGLWNDYFIHYDDVEWCLRIGEMGWRVVVVADSIIWHLSAVAKVPTWVMYYDVRNALATMQAHGADAKSVREATRRILMRAGYYALLGKPDISQLHKAGVDDFLAGRFGKKDIELTTLYRSNARIGEVFMDSRVRCILVASVNLQATGIQEQLVESLLQRPELQVEFLTQPGGLHVYQLPRSRFVSLPLGRIKRYWRFWRLRGRYDLVVQSDYAPYLLLSWVGREVLFVNDEGFCRNPRPGFRDVWNAATWLLRTWFR